MNEFKVGDKIAALASLDKAKVVKGIVYTVEKVETVHDKYLNAFSFQVIYVKGITDDLLPDSFNLATCDEIERSRLRLKHLITVSGKDYESINPYIEAYKEEIDYGWANYNRRLCEEIMGEPKGNGKGQNHLPTNRR